MIPNAVKLLCLATLIPVISGCLDKEKIATIPNAENQLFISDGRLLVTGSKGIYQVTRNGNAYQAQQITTPVGECAFTGLAQTGDWVFTACQKTSGGWFSKTTDNHLLAARVTAGQPLEFAQVQRPSPDPMELLEMPRGMAISPVGDLLIADDRQDGKVYWFWLDVSGTVPVVRRVEGNWLTADHGISRPKGLKVTGREVFVSEHNVVKRFVINPLGRVPLEVMGTQGVMVKNEAVVYKSILTGPLGHIQTHCGGVVIPNLIEGRLLYALPTGQDAHGLPTYDVIHETNHQSLQQPTSVQIGQGPYFNGYEVLITERGTSGDTFTSFGNRLTRVNVTEDLNDPLVCEVINEG